MVGMVYLKMYTTWCTRKSFGGTMGGMSKREDDLACSRVAELRYVRPVKTKQTTKKC